MVVGFVAGMAVGGTAGYLIGRNSGGGGTNNIDQRSYDNRSYDQSQHYYGDMRSVQDVTNILISKAIVDVGMKNSQECSISANVTQVVNARINQCKTTGGDINLNFAQKAEIDFKCIVRSIQNANQTAKFVNDVKAQLKQKIQSDTSVGSEAMTATVQKTMSKIVNETVTKALIENVFKSINSPNQTQMINVDLSNCSARNINIQATMQFEMRAIVTNETQSSFSNQTESFNELQGLFDQENIKLEKASSQMLIWGVVIAVIVIVAIFAVYKFYKKPTRAQGMMMEGPGQMNMGAPMAPGQMGMVPVSPSPPMMQTVNLSKIMPLRTKAFYNMLLSK